MSGEIPKAIHDPWPALREDWAVYEAAKDPHVLAMFGIFATQTLPEETMDLAKDKLEMDILNWYQDVPSHRIPDVFRWAETVVQQEIEANDEA